MATETTVTLSLTEYEASVITGALVEFGERWGEGEREAATTLRERLREQLPADWRD